MDTKSTKKCLTRVNLDSKSAALKFYRERKSGEERRSLVSEVQFAESRDVFHAKMEQNPEEFYFKQKWRLKTEERFEQCPLSRVEINFIYELSFCLFNISCS